MNTTNRLVVGSPQPTLLHNTVQQTVNIEYQFYCVLIDLYCTCCLLPKSFLEMGASYFKVEESY